MTAGTAAGQSYKKTQIHATRGSDELVGDSRRGVWMTGGGAGRANIPLHLVAQWHCT